MVALDAQITNVALPAIRQHLGGGLSGLAPNLPVLIAARLIQGAGAALVTPTSLSLIREVFEDARERARAIALWAVGGSVAAAAGPLLGGVLVQPDWAATSGCRSQARPSCEAMPPAAGSGTRSGPPKCGASTRG